MRNANNSSIGYSPATVPNDPAQIPRYLMDEMPKIQSAVLGLADGHIDMTYAAPAKPREGDLRLADGTTWNPGSGKGFYGYYGSAWHFLG